jgi:spermidine synthase
MRRWLRSWRWILCALLSGGATLAAEVMGARLLRSMLGSTSMAQTAAVSGVLLGLGLGAWIAGRQLTLAAITPRRLLVFSHLALAAFAALAPTLAHSLAAPIAHLLVGADAASSLLGNTLRALVGLASTVLPGALAGSAFPALVMAGGWHGGEGTARVGAANSLGAAGAASLATFVLAPALGVSWTVRLAGLAYAAVAVVAWASSPSPDGAAAGLAPHAVDEVIDDHVASGGRSTLLGLALVGIASTAWQLTLTRLGILAFGPSAFALTAALSAHVISLFLGEAAAAAWIARRPDASAPDALSSLCRLGALGAALALPIALALPRMSMHLLAGGAPSTFTLWSSAMGCVLAATLPLVAFVGAALAQGARALEVQGRSPAQANGAVLLATSVGNGVGAWAVSFGALPLLRLEGTLALSALAMLLAGSLIARRSWWRELAWATLTVAGVLTTLRDARAHPAALLMGPFLYAGAEELELGRVRWRRDGREATVAVRYDDTGGVLLQIDGKVDATSEGDATTQTVVGLVPTAMARNVGTALVVGLGSGMTADAVRSVPGVRSVTVLELLPEVVIAARGDFARSNHRVLYDPRVRARAADAAQWLRGSAETYDAIVSEPSNPWVAGMSELFTEEFFAAAKARLRPGGVMGAWFHAYSTDGETVASVVETFRRVFPRSALVEVSAGQDYLLVGANEPYQLDLDAFFERVESPEARARAERAGIDGRAAWMARFLAGPRGVAAVGEGAEVLSARDLVLEFRAPSLLYRDATAEVFARFARVQDLPLAGLVRDASPGGTWLRVLDESEPLREAGAHLRAMVLAERAGAISRAISEGETAAGLVPTDELHRTRLARLYLQRATLRRRGHDPGGAEADLTEALALRPHVSERFRALVALGDLASRRRDGSRAWTRYTEALDIARAAQQPAPELHVRRAEALAILGAQADAARELEAAIRETTDPARRMQLRALLQGGR